MLTTCPVLAFTAETRDVIGWFGRTHDVEPVGMGGSVWRMKRLPEDGGLADQDAWLMQALDHCRAVHNHLLARRQQQRAESLQTWHEQDRARRKAGPERTH